MQTRGLRLPKGKVQLKADSACDAFARWLSNGANDHQVLALGPLTNLASFALHSPERFNTIDRICWMGGSAGRGNQTAWAEFNAFADPDAVDVVLSSGVPIDIIDLELCRQVAFAEQHMPAIDATSHTSQTLLRDLLGGYLDIALHRGRESMNIYDPVAVLACVEAIPVEFTPCTIKISLAQGEQLGRTRVTPLASSDNAESGDSLSRPSTRICSAIDSEAARAVCMKALQHPWWE
jgi:inosine-uridine nucleoside N-ribohydrolase